MDVLNRFCKFCFLHVILFSTDINHIVGLDDAIYNLSYQLDFRRFLSNRKNLNQFRGFVNQIRDFSAGS